MNNPIIAIGQTYIDRDKRHYGRMIKITDHGTDFVSTRDVVTGRQSKMSVKNLRAHFTLQETTPSVATGRASSSRS